MLIHEFDQQAAADEADEGEWPEWLVQVAPCTHSDGAATATVVSCATQPLSTQPLSTQPLSTQLSAQPLSAYKQSVRQAVALKSE
jgi:hypothetical protein